MQQVQDTEHLSRPGACNPLAASTHIQAGDRVLGAVHCIQRQAELAAVLRQVLHGLHKTDKQQAYSSKSPNTSHR
jgi:hypothetical protein